MILLGTILMTAAGFYGAHKIKTRPFQSKLVHSTHLLKVGSFATYPEALGALERRVPGGLKTFVYSADTTVWYGKLALFGVAFPDAKGIIKKEQSGYILYEED